MEFQITRHTTGIPQPYSWLLHDAAGERLCLSPNNYPSEKDARSAIHTFRTRVRGARFAKVVVVEI